MIPILAIQQCTTDVDPSGQSSSPTNATSAYDTNTAPTTGRFVKLWCTLFGM